MHSRNRILTGVALVVVIALGLASRRYDIPVLSFFGKYPGDALWALMVFLGCAMVRPRASTTRLAVCALAISYADEFSQIYQAPWINSIRATTAGHLVLGSTFSWVDMLAYTIGIAVGACADRVLSGGVGNCRVGCSR